MMQKMRTESLMTYCVCVNRVRRDKQIHTDRQLGKTIKMLGPSVLIGWTFLGPTPSTEYIITRVGMVHRCHGSVRTLVWGSRFDTISVQQKKKKKHLLCSVSFHLFSTDPSTNYYFFSHLDVNILNMITCYIYIYIYIWQVKLQHAERFSVHALPANIDMNQTLSGKPADGDEQS